MLTKPVYLEIDKPNYVPIYTVQYDYNSRFYEITILNNSQPLDLTGIRVIVAGKKPDGKEVFNSCKVLDAKKGLIQLELTEQMNAVNGASEYALELFSADGMLSSQPFKLIVTRSTISKSVESSKELGALKDALNEVQDIDNRFAQTNAQLSDLREHCTGGNGMQDHSHVNKQIIDNFAEIDGSLLYKGGEIANQIEDTIAKTNKTYSSKKINELSNNNLLPLNRKFYTIGQVKGDTTTAKFLDEAIKTTITTGLDGITVTGGSDLYVVLNSDFKMNLLQLDSFGTIKLNTYITTSQKITLREDTKSIIFNISKVGNPKIFEYELENSLCGVYLKDDVDFIASIKDLSLLFVYMNSDFFKQLELNAYNKNLLSKIDSFWNQNTSTRILSNEIHCYPNATLSVNFNDVQDKDIAIHEFDSTDTLLKDSGWITQSTEYKLLNNTKKIKINCRFKTNAAIYPVNMKRDNISISFGKNVDSILSDKDKDFLFNKIDSINSNAELVNKNLIPFDATKWHQGMYTYASGLEPKIVHQNNRLVMEYIDLPPIKKGDTICVSVNNPEFRIAVCAVGEDYLQKHDSGWITEKFQYTYGQDVSRLNIIISKTNNGLIMPNDIRFLNSKIELESFSDFNYSIKDINKMLLSIEREHPLFTKNEFRLIAHRGAYSTGNDIPENSIKAFENAGKLGFWGIETDISETLDGEFVIMHDETVDRTTDGTGNIREMTFSQVRNLKLTGASDGEILRVPTFKEYLLICKKYGAIPVIEIKNLDNVEGLFNEIKSMGFEEKCTVISFDRKKLIELRRLSEKIHIQFLDNISENSINYVRSNKYSALNCGTAGLTEELIRYAHEQGVLIFTNTINDKETVVSHFNMFVDGVVTDTVISI